MFILVLVMASAAAPPVRPAASAGVADSRLAALLEAHWEFTVASSPTWATQLGDHRFDAQIEDNSKGARARRVAQNEGFLARATRLKSLGENDALTRDVLVTQLRDGLAVEACRFADWSFSARTNAFTFAADLGREHPLPDGPAVAALVSRYRALPRYIDTEVANLQRGLDTGRVANRVSVEKVIAMVDVELALPTEKQALLAPLRDPHLHLSAVQETDLQGDLAAEVAGPVRQALIRYRDFLKQKVLPRARGAGQEGLSALPGGLACYAARARQETTTSRSPAEIHQTGLDELKRIHAEMAALGERTLGTAEVTAVLGRLRDDPTLRFATREEVEATARAALARAEAAIPNYFGVLPKGKCVVKPIPDHEAPYTTIAYYWPVAPEGSAPGVYYVNSWQPETRTRFDAEVLAYHEAIPGHHLQIAMAVEAAALPLFRQNAGFTAFVEGWALYTERLSDEMGLYSGDLDRLGMLGFDTWRASRLVVDTGVHTLGWSREQAIQFMLDNTPLARNNIENEVDRYLTWPGQALGYKVGQLELARMRREAEAALGSRFDIKGFHDVVLTGGALPLDRVEARVKRWVASRI